MTPRLRIIPACLVLAGLPVQAQESDPGAPAPLFLDAAPIEVTIEAPFTTLMEQRPDETYLDGRFTYTARDGKAIALDVKLRSRGHFRRKETTCDFPPIRLNFQKKEVANTVFDGQDKLKLVTHCQNLKPSYEQLVYREYLAYRLLNLLTEKSFDVRALNVHYVDTESDFERSRFAFVIEDEDQMAARLRLAPVKIVEIEHSDLVPGYENLVNVFQFMIGNTDYSLVIGPEGENCCHNAILLSAGSGPPYYAVPYDFDFSGLVNAPYASADKNFHLRSVRQRLYRGQCRNNELLPQTFKLFNARRADMGALVEQLEAARPATRKNAERYLDAFFRTIANPDDVERDFIEKCN